MLTTDRHEASCGLFATAELLVHLCGVTFFLNWADLFASMFENVCDCGQVAELISALTFIRESDSDVVVPDSQSVHKPRFRLTVIAVIAANRLIRWSASGCRLSAVCSSLRAGPISNILCVGDVQTDINSHFNGISQHIYLSRFRVRV